MPHSPFTGNERDIAKFSLIASAAIHLSTKSLLVMKREFFCKRYGNKWTWLKPSDSVQRPKVSRFDLKHLICILWNSSGILHYRPLEKDRTVASDMNCCQLIQVVAVFRFNNGRTTKRCSARPSASNRSKHFEL